MKQLQCYKNLWYIINTELNKLYCIFYFNDYYFNRVFKFTRPKNGYTLLAKPTHKSRGRLMAAKWSPYWIS